MPERLGWFFLGNIIGFLLGHTIGYYRERKQGRKHMDSIVKRDEGFVRQPIVLDIMLILVTGLTIWAALTSQMVNQDVRANQSRISRLSTCNQFYLTKTIEALNARTTYTGAQATANLNLQQAQQKFLELLLHQPPLSTKEQHQALVDYVAALKAYTEANTKTQQSAEAHPFPTNNDLVDCLNPK